MDGQHVGVLFLLLTPSVRDHLRLLSRLAAALHDEALKKLLNAAAPRAEILDRIAGLEKESGR
jgi:PTS system nitrogen regulatory IIA component